MGMGRGGLRTNRGADCRYLTFVVFTLLYAVDWSLAWGQCDIFIFVLQMQIPVFNTVLRVSEVSNVPNGARCAKCHICLAKRAKSARSNMQKKKVLGVFKVSNVMP